MPVESPGVKLTYDDFVLFPDDGKRHELIDGEHYVSPTPNVKHQRIVGNIYFLMRTWLETHPVGELFGVPLDVVLSRFDVVEPDLQYISRDRAAKVLTELNVQGAPNLVVEVGSKSTRKRDETIKLLLYERTGVEEYWLVDPWRDRIRVYRRDAGMERFTLPITLSQADGDVLETPLMPGLAMPLARIFK
jgi:Uma2 family endonuclease